MFALRSRRVGLLLLVAVWQLFLPLFAYAHMSKTGALTQEVCTTLGMRTVFLESSPDAHKSPADNSTQFSSAHECCVFNLHAPTGSALVAVLPEIKPDHLVLPWVSAPRASLSLGLHAPATGPPRS